MHTHTHTYPSHMTVFEVVKVFPLSHDVLSFCSLPSSVTHLYLSVTPVTKTHCHCSSFKSMLFGETGFLSQKIWEKHIDLWTMKYKRGALWKVLSHIIQLCEKRSTGELLNHVVKIMLEQGGRWTFRKLWMAAIFWLIMDWG